MRAWKKCRAAPPIVYQFLLDQHKNIDSLNLMTIRKLKETDSLCTPLLASAFQREPQATLSQGHGDLGFGMIRSGCRLALVEIRFACQHCRMPCGFLAHRRRVICHFAVLGGGTPPLHLLRMDSSHRRFVHQSFIHC